MAAKRDSKRILVLGGLIAFVAIAGFVSGHRVTAGPNAQLASGYRYSAKFVCGIHPEFPGSATATAINIHNPYSSTIGIEKKAVQAPEEPNVGVPGTRLMQSLPPDGAFEVDCPDILGTLLGLPSPFPPFVKGFVVIDSPVLIDVWGVYTSTTTLGPPTAGVIQSEDKEIITGQALPIPQPDPVLAYTYSAKFICGTVAEPFDVNSDPLVPATYHSDINVHNPNEDTVESLGLLKKVVLAPREPQVGQPLPFVPLQVPPDGAFEDNCSTIYGLLGPTAPTEGLGVPPNSCSDGADNDSDGPVDIRDPDCFAKGFFVVESPRPIDVVGVYFAESLTTFAPDGGAGGEIDIEAVPFTRQPFPTIGKLNLSPYFDCRHQHIAQNPTTVHVDCILLAAPPQQVFDWEVIYADQTPAMVGPAITNPTWGCSPGFLGWVADTSLVSTRVKCEDQTHGGQPWLVGQCRDIDFAVPGAQGPWNPLVLHATDAQQNNLGTFVSFVATPGRC